MRRFNIVGCSSLGLVLLACGGSDGKNGANGAEGADGEDGATTLSRISDEDPGDNCEDGGQRIDFGIDSDEDGDLADEEVSSTAYVCNGADGADGAPTIVETISLDEGDENCPNGGLVIRAGVDADGDGELSESEGTTTYVCNGSDGADGPTGPTGPAGPTGATGPMGPTGPTDGPMVIALEAAPNTTVRNPGESLSVISNLLTTRGHTVAIVAGTDIDTLAEITSYDVVVLSDVQATGSGLGAPSDYATFDGVIDDFVANGGGLVASGRHLFAGNLPTNLAALTPVGQGSGLLAGDQVATPSLAHPIAFGVGGFTSPESTPYGNGVLKAGAVAILSSEGTIIGGA